jgi:hypothetical protein
MKRSMTWCTMTRAIQLQSPNAHPIARREEEEGGGEVAAREERQDLPSGFSPPAQHRPVEPVNRGKVQA